MATWISVHMDVLRKAGCREMIFDLCDLDVEREMLCLSHESCTLYRNVFSLKTMKQAGKR